MAIACPFWGLFPFYAYTGNYIKCNMLLVASAAYNVFCLSGALGVGCNSLWHCQQLQLPGQNIVAETCACSIVSCTPWVHKRSVKVAGASDSRDRTNSRTELIRVDVL